MGEWKYPDDGNVGGDYSKGRKTVLIDVGTNQEYIPQPGQLDPNSTLLHDVVEGGRLAYRTARELLLIRDLVREVVVEPHANNKDVEVITPKSQKKSWFSGAKTKSKSTPVIKADEEIKQILGRSFFNEDIQGKTPASDNNYQDCTIPDSVNQTGWDGCYN